MIGQVGRRSGSEGKEYIVKALNRKVQDALALQCGGNLLKGLVTQAGHQSGQTGQDLGFDQKRQMRSL